jgi:DNA-binding response OmpR family regulator
MVELHPVFTSARKRGVVTGNLNKRIVVVDDDPSVQDIARAYLERDGYLVFAAATAEQGLELADHVSPALIVLDLVLPDGSGPDVCHRVRARSDVPLLMLTPKTGAEESVARLAVGADDFLTKPFAPRELVGRVRAVLRRSQGAAEKLAEVLSLDGGALEIDTVRQEVRRGGRPVELTPYEYKLLVALARHPGRLYSRFELVTLLRGVGDAAYERGMDTHVKNLRRKIEPDPRRPRYVQTVYGGGYRLARH